MPEKPVKKGCLGCSFPLVISLAVVFLALLAIGFLAGPVGQGFLHRLGVNINFPSWLVVSKPELELPAETVFHLFGFPITNSILGAWVTIIFLVGFSWAITRRMKLIPGRLQMVFESLIGWVYDLCCSVAGEKNGRRFFPVVTTIFLFVGFNAWLGLFLPIFGSITAHTAEGVVPLFRPANTDINLPLALALTSFFFIEFYGLKSLGFRYLAKFLNFKEFFRGLGQMFTGKFKAGLSGLVTGAMNIFSGFLEGLSEFIRIISLTFRLFGNMTAGETLVLVLLFLVPFLPVISIFLPYGLELLIGFIQAIIFGGLTLVFLNLAVESHGEEAH